MFIISSHHGLTHWMWVLTRLCFASPSHLDVDFLYPWLCKIGSADTLFSETVVNSFLCVVVDFGVSM